MSETGRKAWRNPIATKCLYFLTEESFQTGDPVGTNWAKGRLKPGDILLCEELSGDCFYTWYLLGYTHYTDNQDVHVRLELVPHTFGAYAMKAHKLTGFTERDYHLLLAGEKVEVMTKFPK